MPTFSPNGIITVNGPFTMHADHDRQGDFRALYADWLIIAMGDEKKHNIKNEPQPNLLTIKSMA